MGWMVNLVASTDDNNELELSGLFSLCTEKGTLRRLDICDLTATLYMISGI
jgi:hypothetical protein